jgi:hypothetical protein
MLKNKSNVRWKIQEACLMAVGRTSEELIQALQDKENPANFDLAGLFEHVVLENMKLTGRSKAAQLVLEPLARLIIT